MALSQLPQSALLGTLVVLISTAAYTSAICRNFIGVQGTFYKCRALYQNLTSSSSQN